MNDHVTIEQELAALRQANERLQAEIAKHRQAEDQLRESEARFRRITENVCDLVIQLDVQGRVEYISPSIGPMLGCAPQDLLGKTVFDRVHPEDRGRMVDEFHHSITTGEPRQAEFRYAHASGEMLWLQTAATVLRDPAGQVTGLVVTAREITGQKRLEHLAHEHASRMQLLTDNMVDAISQIDTNRIIVYASPSVERVYGVKPEELVGLDGYERIHPDDIERIRHQALATIAAHAQTFQVEYRYLHGRGEYVWVESTLRLLFEENGEYAGAVLSSRDITERKRAELALQESEERFRQIAENIKEVFWLFDWQRQRVLYVSPAYELIWGRSRAALYERFEEWTESIHPDDLAYARETLRRILETGGGEPREYRILRPDGTERWISDVGYAVQDQDGQVLRLTGTAEDITERKRVEQLLGEREARFRALLQNSSDVITVLQADGTAIYQSPCLKRVLGYEPEELIGINGFDLVHPEDRASSWAAFAGLCSQPLSTMATIEYRFRHAQGHWVNVESIVTNRLQDPLIGGLVLNTRDVTERKQIEQSLHQEQEFIHTLLENMAEGVLACDATGRLILINRTAREWHGLAPAQTLHGEWALSDHLYREDGVTPLTTATLPLARANRGERLHDERMVIRAPDRPPRYVTASSSPLYDSEGQLLGAVVVTHDRTAARQAHKELENTKALLEATFEQTPVPMVLLSTPDNVVRMANQAAAQFLLDENEPVPIGRYFPDYKPSWQDLDSEGRPVPMAEMPLVLALQGITTRSKEFSVLRRDGTRRWELVSAAPIYNAAGEQIAAFVAFPDITEQKLAEREIRRLNDELEQRVIERTAQLEAANQEMEAFTYSVSHDLRAPLRAIDGYTHILLEDYGASMDDGGKRVCAVIRSNTRRMARLIDDLLAFSRLGRLDLHISRIDMQALVKAVFAEVTTPQERARIDFQLEPLPPATGDPTLIHQVWTNLLANAVKFSAHRERATIHVGASREERENCYFVRDNGAGFDMRYVDKLFGVFQRLHSEREFTGTGVGLAIVRQVVQRHGGRVWAEGQPDQGATFHFSLPAAATR